MSHVRDVHSPAMGLDPCVVAMNLSAPVWTTSSGSGSLTLWLFHVWPWAPGCRFEVHDHSPTHKVCLATAHRFLFSRACWPLFIFPGFGRLFPVIKIFFSLCLELHPPCLSFSDNIMCSVVLDIWKQNAGTLCALPHDSLETHMSEAVSWMNQNKGENAGRKHSN